MENENNSLEQKNVKTLCIISLALQILPWILTVIMVTVLDVSQFQTREASNSVVVATMILQAISLIAAWILMIVARVKNKKSVFAKVLMWVYIVLLVLEIALPILFFVWLSVSCSGLP